MTGRLQDRRLQLGRGAHSLLQNPHGHPERNHPELDPNRPTARITLDVEVQGGGRHKSTMIVLASHANAEPPTGPDASAGELARSPAAGKKRIEKKKKKGKHARPQLKPSPIPNPSRSLTPRNQLTSRTRARRCTCHRPSRPTPTRPTLFGR